MTTTVERKISGDPTVAVALGGGGARGYAHIHVIEVLNEMGVVPVAMAGSSIGGIMSSAMASAMTGKEIHEYSLELASNRTDAIARFIRSRPSGVQNLIKGEFSPGQLDALSLLKEFLPKQIRSTFEALDFPVSIATTDYYAYKEKIFDSGDLFPPMAASSSIPGAFRPIKCDGRYLVDGGIFNPVPFDHLTGKADIIIGVDVVGTPRGDATKPPKAIDSMYGASQLMMQSILSHKLELSPPDILLRPKVSQFRVQDFFKAKRVLESSFGVREELKRALDEKLNTLAKSA